MQRLVVAAAAVVLSATGFTGAGAATVTVAGQDILVDGRPTFIKGAAGDTRLDLLKALGANTVRTYGGDPGPILDAARKHGLKVIVGLSMGKPRRGFRYSDAAAVKAQLDDTRRIVRRYKDDPALLMWGIGNETEAQAPNPTRVWNAIEDVAKAVKALDPDHPTMAVVQELGNGKARAIRKLAPDIDVLGVNSYGNAIPSIAARARQQGWTGPVVVTELGALGQWQAPKTPWGAAIEPTSTEKADRLRRYLAATAAPATSGQILFYWGQKQEVTPTWHSLFLPDGDWTEAMEVMAAAWGGHTPGGDHAPRITGFTLGNPAPDGARKVHLAASDSDGDPLSVSWQVMSESTDLGVGGDPEAVPPSHPEAVASASRHGATIAGLRPGNYRVFVTVRDGRGAAATGNIPFRVPPAPEEGGS